MLKIAIIGAGAAGLMAAAVCAEQKQSTVTVFEKNPVCAKKLCITGKGRCNLTNTAEIAEMHALIPRGAKFLRSALYAFPPSEVMGWFEACGVPLKVERGGRVFPVSDKAVDVANALCRKALSEANVELCKKPVLSLSREENGFLIRTDRAARHFDRVLIATGGLSYPRTGSTGDGYRFAEALGHRVETPKCALCPVTVKEKLCREAMGLSLKNCGVRVETESGKKVYEDFGELMLCHFGLSGPTVLSASSYLDFETEKRYRIVLDLKPALSEEELNRRVLSDFEEVKNRDLINALDRLLPQKLIAPLIEYARLDPRKKVHEITKAERGNLVRAMKALTLTLTGHRPIEEAIVTRGGVALSEIDPRTMQSKIVPGLFFAGEVMDVDALTGGFNLQIAFATGHLAGMNLTREEV